MGPLTIVPLPQQRTAWSPLSLSSRAGTLGTLPGTHHRSPDVNPQSPLPLPGWPLRVKTSGTLVASTSHGVPFKSCSSTPLLAAVQAVVLHVFGSRRKWQGPGDSTSQAGGEPLSNWKGPGPGPGSVDVASQLPSYVGRESICASPSFSHVPGAPTAAGVCCSLSA